MIAIGGSFIIAQSEGNYTCFDRAGKVLLEQSDYISPAGGEYAYFTREGKEGMICSILSMSTNTRRISSKKA
ncbi:MAG: hypothetical protein K2N80_02070 [Lachnospiraceae bacterium]|nr:hypothetical protein [Lachnospiraceae bacterium]